MDGTGLTEFENDALNTRISNQANLSTALLSAILGATNGGLDSFSLTDLGNHPTGQTPALNLQTLKKALGVNLSAATQLTLQEWRRLAISLENDAALQASKRSVNDGGGVKTVNGKWFINGQEVNLLDVYMACRVNQVSNFDGSLKLHMNDLTASNKLVKAANEWLAKIRALKPTDTSSKIAWSKITAAGNSFSSTFGYLPSVFMPTAWGSADAGESYNYLKFDTWVEECKNYVSQKDTDNQVTQQKLEQLTNRRGEVLEGLTSFIKSQSQNGQVTARNLG